MASERKMQKSLSKLLQEQEQEQEEPLVFSKKRQQYQYHDHYHYQLRSSPLKGKSTTTLREAATRILEPRLHSCSRPRPRPVTVRYLVHLDRMANIKRSKRLRKSEVEYVDEQGEGKKTSTAWQKAAEALLNAFGLSPAVETARLFCFQKNRGGGATGETGQRKNKYNLLKSILRRVGPSKDCIKDASGIHRDTVSEDFSNAGRTLSRPEMQGSDQGRLRIYDIVRWNSFEESQFLDIYAAHSRTNSLREKESRADFISSTCFSSMETQERKDCGRGNVEDWLEDLSFSSSSTTWLESSLDSDCGSNYTGRSSSSDCSELNGSDPDSDPCNLEESYFSPEIYENGGAGDFYHNPRSAANMISTKPQMCDAVCNRYVGSVTCIQKDYTPASSALITIPLNFMTEIDEVTSADDVKSNSSDIEEKECAPYMNGRVSERGSKVSSENANENENSEEEEDAEQQSPISVLDSSGFEQSLATIQKARKHVVRKICEYEQLAQMNPVVLQRKMCTSSSSSRWAWEEIQGEGEGDTEKLVEMELMSGREEWKSFRVEREEIGMKIEVAIYRVLLEELLLDLLALHSF